MLNSNPTTAIPAPSAQFSAFCVYFVTSFVPIDFRNLLPCCSTWTRRRWCVLSQCWRPARSCSAPVRGGCPDATLDMWFEADSVRVGPDMPSSRPARRRRVERREVRQARRARRFALLLLLALILLISIVLSAFGGGTTRTAATIPLGALAPSA